METAHLKPLLEERSQCWYLQYNHKNVQNNLKEFPTELDYIFLLLHVDVKRILRRNSFFAL
jgi:hypothetical protein